MKKHNERPAAHGESRFLLDLDGADVAWPLVNRHEHREPGAGGTLDVFVCGNLVIDIPIELQLPLATLAAALNNRDEKVRCDWSFGKVTVGGFAGHAARAVHALGHRVFLSTVVPLPFHQHLAEFFREVDADTSHVVAFPGDAPAAIHLQCTDGHVLVPRPGVQASAPPRVPANVLERFDCVLINPGDPPGRAATLQALGLKAARQRRAAVAVCGKANWAAADFAILHGAGAWVFFNDLEAIAAARRVAPQANITTAEEAAKTLKARLGSSRLVVTLGAKGAYLYNGSFQHIPAEPVANGRSVGAGDTMLSVCGVRAALGVEDEEAVTAGVVAASRKVAGLPVT